MVKLALLHKCTLYTVIVGLRIIIRVGVRLVLSQFESIALFDYVFVCVCSFVCVYMYVCLSYRVCQIIYVSCYTKGQEEDTKCYLDPSIFLFLLSYEFLIIYQIQYIINYMTYCQADSVSWETIVECPFRYLSMFC